MQKQLAMGALFCGLAWGLAPQAQATDQSTDQRIKALEARVSELERRQGITEKTPPAAVAPAAAPVASIPAAAPVAAAPAVTAAPARVADWGALHRGMSQHEVIAALGAPKSKQVRPLLEIWFYPGDRSVQFDRDSRLDSWSGQ